MTTREINTDAHAVTDVVTGSLTFRVKTWGARDGLPLLVLGHVPDVPFSLDALAAALAQSKLGRRVLVP